MKRPTKETHLAVIIILFLVLLLLSLLLGGCSGPGFGKKATLIPDRIGVSFGQQRYESENSAWRGFTINAQWDLK